MKQSLFKSLVLGIIIGAICFGLDVVFDDVDTGVEHLIRIIVLFVVILLITKFTDRKS